MAGLARAQRQVEEVAELMQQNLGRALERDGRLRELDSRALQLRDMGATFARSTRGVAQQQRRGHRRWHLVTIGLATTLLLLLLLGLLLWLLLPPPVTVVVTVTVPKPLPGTPLLAGSEATG